jgi:hypothetical protein
MDSSLIEGRQVVFDLRSLLSNFLQKKNTPHQKKHAHKKHAHKKQPINMNWGNTTLLAGTTLRDMEDIFVDDVQDGMASMADEMASGTTIFLFFLF